MAAIVGMKDFNAIKNLKLLGIYDAVTKARTPSLLSFYRKYIILLLKQRYGITYNGRDGAMPPK